MRFFTLVILILVLCVPSAIGETETRFNPTTQPLLIASGSYWVLEAGVGLDLSMLPHITGSLLITHSVPVLVEDFEFTEDIRVLHIEPAIKYFFPANNTGPYAIVGTAFHIISYGDSDLLPPLTYFTAGVGLKAVLFDLLVFDFNVSAPTFLLFDSGFAPNLDYMAAYGGELYMGSMKLALGLQLGAGRSPTAAQSMPSSGDVPDKKPLFPSRLS